MPAGVADAVTVLPFRRPPQSPKGGNSQSIILCANSFPHILSGKKKATPMGGF